MYTTARRPTVNYNRKKTATVRRLQNKENYIGKPTLPTTSHCKAIHFFSETH